MTATILIVDDEAHIAAALQLNLELEGMRTQIAPTLSRARELVVQSFAVIVLDVMLPDGSGIDFCADLRARGNYTPVLMLTAKDGEQDRVRGLEAGADDYLPKPFALAELLARVRSLKRRQDWQLQQASSRLLTFGSACVDFDTHVATCAGERVQLTQLELDLLAYFAKHAGRVIPREELLLNVWKMPAAVTTRTVDNFVLRLRKHFEKDPQAPQHFLSHRGSGYQFKQLKM